MVVLASVHDWENSNCQNGGPPTISVSISQYPNPTVQRFFFYPSYLDLVDTVGVGW